MSGNIRIFIFIFLAAWRWKATNLYVLLDDHILCVRTILLELVIFEFVLVSIDDCACSSGYRLYLLASYRLEETREKNKGQDHSMRMQSVFKNDRKQQSNNNYFTCAVNIFGT